MLLSLFWSPRPAPVALPATESTVVWVGVYQKWTIQACTAEITFPASRCVESFCRRVNFIEDPDHVVFRHNLHRQYLVAEVEVEDFFKMHSRLMPLLIRYRPVHVLDSHHLIYNE